MKTRNFNLGIAAAGFVIGAVFMLSDEASVNANVIGYSGSNYAIASIIGLAMIIASAAFFILTISMGKDNLELERLVRKTDAHHTEIRSIQNDQELEEKYETEHPARKHIRDESHNNNGQV